MEYLSEEIKKKSYELLDESLGSFERQHVLAREIACAAYDMMVHGVNRNVIDVDNGIIKSVDLTLSFNTPSYDFRGTIENLNDEGTVFVKIDIPARCRHMSNSDYVIGRFSVVLSHELMHANIFLNRFNNNEEISDAPIYYPNLIAVIRNEREGSVMHAVAYALYSTYYHEIQAFVSQTAQEIKDMFGGKLKYSNDEIRRGIKDSESYIIYSNNINGPLKDAINMSDEDLEHMVVEPFARKYDIHFSLSEWRKNLAKAYNLSKKALGMIYRNAMLLMMEPKVEL